VYDSAVGLPRKPMTGTAFCWARSARAAVIAPPSSSISLRRLIRRPRRRGRAAVQPVSIGSICRRGAARDIRDADNLAIPTQREYDTPGSNAAPI
jgi:hypothetical protein